LCLSHQMQRRVDLSASAILKILVLASVAVSLLWLVRVDRGAMMMLLGSLVFALAAFVCYLIDPVGGTESAKRGYVVGGLSALVWVPCVVVQAWIQRGDGSSPRSIWLPVLFIPILLICASFGAAVGSMVSVIGGLVLRTIGAVVRAVLMPAQSSKNKVKSNGPGPSLIDEPLF
jgi:hypothetical protein